jgi:ABC-2 type transport system ATP-binding protein
MGAAITTTALTKRYRGGRLAVDGVDLSVPAGAVFGLLGPNGSGKTTILRMLLGLIRPTAGRLRMLGHDSVVDALGRVGALVEGPGFQPHLSGRANLVRLDRADRDADPSTRAARIDSVLERVRLQAAAGSRYRTYSLGMRQRLGIGAALLRPRELLILDEPTNGLDPQGIRELRGLVTGLAEQGTTVLLCSHLLAEAAHLCTDIAVLKTGRLLWQGPLAEFGTRPPRARIETPDPGRLAATLTRLGLPDITPHAGGTSAGLAGRAPEQLLGDLVAAGVPIRSFALERLSLEDAFVDLTGAGFDVHD